jgi:hypothetical protein
MNTSSGENSSVHTPLAPADVREAIRRRAEEIYVWSGKVPRHDLENLALAEEQIKSEIGARPAPARRAVVVRVDGVEYLGEYLQELSDGYVPGELGTGIAVFIRFDGDKMFVKRPNGKELETVNVKKVG